MREDWVKCTFDDITSNLKRGPFGGDLKKEMFVAKGYKVYEQQHAINNNFSLGKYYINEEHFNNLKACEASPGDYIVSCSGTLGKIARLPMNSQKGIINQALLRIRIEEKIIEHNFFLFFFRSSLFQQKILSDTRGSGIQNMAGIKEIKPIKITIPPLPEQRAIVKKIETLFSSLDASIADLKKSQEQLKIYRQAVLKKAFEGELTNTKIIRKKFSEISNTIGDGLHGTPKYDIDGKYYFINGNNLNDGVIIIKPETKKVNEIEYLKYKKELNNHTVFVSINGTIGNTAFYNNEPIILGKSACYINLLEDIDKKYIHYHLKTTEFLNYALKNATGSTIKNVGLKTMREYLVPIPLLLEKQHQIVKEIESRLSVCDDAEKQIKNSLDQAEALRQSILKKAFEGSLLNEEELKACKEEPDYEPASVLLERIKAEKETHKPVKKTNKKKVS